MRNRCIPSTGSILAGLLTSQVLGLIHVYLSNMDLYHKLTAIGEAGYFTVPNTLAILTLKGVGNAFWGGLFFTLSTGAALTFLTMAALWLWINVFRKNRFALIPLILVWTALLAGTNAGGFNPMASAYFIFVPVAVLISSWKRIISGPEKRARLHAAIITVPIILLSILWSTLLFQETPVTFSNIRNIRDYYMLSNQAGIAVYDFYYRYTLYASEAIKPLRLKVFRTCGLSNLEKDRDLRSMKDRLVNRGYLVVNSITPELKIDKQGDELVFLRNNKEVFRTSKTSFLSDTGAYLNDFSDQTDIYDFFRLFTYLSILTALPITIYMLMVIILQGILGLITNRTRSLISGAAICLLAGVALFIPLYGIRDADMAASGIEGALQGDRWQDTVTALRGIYADGLEITDYQAYTGLKDSPRIPVRYWLIKALGAGKGTETYDELFHFLDDPYPNIVCLALEAIGERGTKGDAEKIIQGIKESPYLYVQFNAYRAMRDLGWKQSKSIYNN